MASFNKITLIGNLGRDPELRVINNDLKVAEFSIATTERFTANGQQQEKTEWFRVSFWNKQAELVMNYLKKGNPVFVEGTLSVRTYVDKDGKDRYSLEVRGSTIQLLGSKDSNNQAQESGSSYTSQPATAAPATSEKVPSQPVPPAVQTSDVDDLPF